MLAQRGLGTVVIVNRRAHHLAKDGAVLAAIREAARGRATLHETWSLAELDEVASHIAKRGAREVVLAGGDGAYMAGVTALRRAFGDAMPSVALAPGGTVCTIARNWGFRGQMGPYAARLVRGVLDQSSPTTRVPTLRVRDAAGGDRVGFIFGAGLVTSFFEAYYAGKTGTIAAARIVARTFIGSLFGGALARKILTPVAASLTIDGSLCVPRAWSLIASSVVRDLGLHMRVTYRAGEEPDRIHLIASPLTPRALGPQMPLVLAGRRLFGRGHVDTQARAFEVRFASSGAYVLDGELLQADQVTIDSGPTLRLLLAP